MRTLSALEAGAVVPIRAHAELDAELMRYMLSHLFVLNCMTCEESLGDKRPSVEIRHMVHGFVQASLHHRTCRKPVWVPNCLEISEVQSSYSAHYWWLDSDEDGCRYPCISVNPSMESVGVRRRNGKPETLTEFALNMEPYRTGTLARPTPGFDMVVGTQQTKPGERTLWLMSEAMPLWGIELPYSFIQEARALGSIQWFISHGYDAGFEFGPEGRVQTTDDALELFREHNTHFVCATFLGEGED